MKKIYQFFHKIYSAETNSRKWCIFTIAVSLGIVLGAALLVFIVDPHYRYRKPFFYDMVYYEIYATAPHLLEHQEYDLLMLGSSMARNFFLENINAAFDCNAIKLAASGGTIPDLCKFFEIAKASRGKELKRVVWSLDTYALNKEGDHYSDFDYLYRKDHKEDYRYLFSRKSYSSIHYLIKRKQRPKRNRKHQTDRNRMFSTDYAGKPYGIKVVAAETRRNYRINNTQAPYNAAMHKENFYNRLLPVFDRNPQLPFTVYLPPYHIYAWCHSEKLGNAEAMIRQRSEVMLELIKRPNVELFDFQSSAEYVENHSDFCDVQHFSNITARRILDDIKNKRKKITTAGDVRESEKALRNIIKRNMPGYNRIISNGKEI